MGVRRKAAIAATGAVAPAVSASSVRMLLDRAIDGFGPIRSAAAAADSQLVAHHGDVEDAIAALVRHHVRLAGVQGFVTNIGGLTTLAVAVPANVAGVALVQCHLVAGIAHLRGYSLGDPRVRNAILACLLGKDEVRELVLRKKLPTSPMALATSPVHSVELDERISREVTTALFSKVVGRRAVILVGRRVPLLGGGVGAATDAWSTREIGLYAASELKDRRLGRRA